MSDTKNELNDIILNKNGGELGGMKKILLAVATFAVLLIVVIVIMGSFSDDSKGVQTPQEQSEQKVLPPSPDDVAVEDGPQLFKPAVVTQDGNNTPIQATPVMPTPDSQDVEVVQEDPVVIDDPYVPSTTTPPVEKPTPTPVPKPTPAPTPVPTPKPQPKPATISDVVLGKHYIQVGSFTKAPNNALLKKIARLGYSYTTQRTTVHGKPLTKLLIGPYSSYTQAKQSLSSVKRDIEKNAYVYKAR